MLVNLHKTDVREWIKNPNNIYIGRKTKLLEESKWHNPFRFTNENSRRIAVNKFERDIRSNTDLLKDIQQLRGKTLGCWCKPKACHGNVILKLIQESMASANATVTSTATFTTTATIDTSGNNLLASAASGQFSPRPFGGPKTRSSTGVHIQSAYMRVKVSPDKTPTSSEADVLSNSSSSSFSIADSPETFTAQSPITSPSANSQTFVTVLQKPIDPVDIDVADLLRRVTSLEEMMQQQVKFSLFQQEKIKKLEKKVNSLEGQLIIVNSQFSVRDHIIEGLQGEINRLQQYTRRYTVSITGIEKKPNETPEILQEEVHKLVGEVTSDTTVADIDKFHRNGRSYNNGKNQEILLRFKSHSAKEAFYRGRKTLPPTRRNVKIRPSLSAYQKNLLDEAETIVEEFNLRDEVRNPVEFVFANIHGETQVKLKNKFRGSNFVTFRSVTQLISSLNQVQSVKRTDEKFHEFASWADQPQLSEPQTQLQQRQTSQEQGNESEDDMGFEAM